MTLTSVVVMTTHITSLHIRSVPVLDQDEALDFWTTHLGFEVRDDIDLGFMRWLTVGVPGQDTSILLELVGGPQHDESTATQVRDLRRAARRRRRDHPGAGRAALRHRLRHPRPVRQPDPDQPAQRRLERRGPGRLRRRRGMIAA